MPDALLQMIAVIIFCRYTVSAINPKFYVPSVSRESKQ